MNINDVPNVEIEGDKLEAIFVKQQKLEEKYVPIERSVGAYIPALPLDINTFEGQERARTLIYRIAEELFEAGNCLRNKAWKQSQVPVDTDHFLEEISDAVHFVIALYLELGLTAQDFCNLYFRKSKVNEFRQETKY